MGAAHAAGFHAAVRSFADTEARNHIIHHDGAGMNTPGQALATLRVARPDARRQAVFGVVGQANGLIVVGARHHRQHWTESFLAHDAHVLGHAGQYSGSVEVHPQFRKPGSPGQNPRSARLCVFHVRFHNPHLPILDHRAHIGMRVHAVAHAQLLRLFRAGFGKRLVQTLVNIAALDRQTGLPRVDECTPNRRARGHVHVGVVEDQHGILPAKFEHHRQQSLRRSRCDPLPGPNAAGEHQLVDRRTQQRRPGRALADNHLKHILGHTRRMQQ